MGLFGKPREIPSEDSLGLVRDLISAQDDRLRALESGQKSLLLEWESAYDKVHKAVQRLNKARRDLDKAEDRSGETNGDSGGAPTQSDFRARVLERRRTHGR